MNHPAAGKLVIPQLVLCARALDAYHPQTIERIAHPQRKLAGLQILRYGGALGELRTPRVARLVGE